VSWVANFYNTSTGRLVEFSFPGRSEPEAIAKAETWWKNRNFTSDIVMSEDETTDQPHEKPKSQKGAVFVGKIWVCHVSQPSKRIDESEFETYAAQGFIRGKKFIK
jgi:hypothetical protein